MSILFADMYNEFELQVATLFGTDHKELDDNILIENNSELKLEKGFCVQWTNADNSERSLNGKSIRQTVIVTNTLKNLGNFTDVTARKRAVRDILENCHRLVEWIEQNPQLNDNAVLVEFIGHPGPELIIDQSNKAYLMIQATYQLEWF
jgi:hypothetical protein